MIKIKELEKGIKLVEVENESGLYISFLNVGAGVYDIKLKNTPLVLRPDGLNEYINSSQFFGKTLGAVAGRIASKREVNNILYNFKTNQYEDFLLHSGENKGLSFKKFSVKIKERKNDYKVIFRRVKKDFEDGITGSFKVEITYVVSKTKNIFKILFKSKCLSDGFISLSNHIYWNLGGDYDINNYKLKFSSFKIAEFLPTLLITGIKDNPEYFNFEKYKKLKLPLDSALKYEYPKTIDHTFIFDKSKQVRLKNNKYELILDNDFEAMNIYVDNSKTNVNFNLSNIKDEERRAIALEPQEFILNDEKVYKKAGDITSNFIKYTIKELK